VLTQPVAAIPGVSQVATGALQGPKTETIFDLAANGTFQIAAAVAGAMIRVSCSTGPANSIHRAWTGFCMSSPTSGSRRTHWTRLSRGASYGTGAAR
jgi:hypothetical protein